MTDLYTSRADTPAELTQTASGDLSEAEATFEAVVADEATALPIYCSPVMDRIRTCE